METAGTVVKIVFCHAGWFGVFLNSLETHTLGRILYLSKTPRWITVSNTPTAPHPRTEPGGKSAPATTIPPSCKLDVLHSTPALAGRRGAASESARSLPTAAIPPTA